MLRKVCGDCTEFKTKQRKNTEPGRTEKQLFLKKYVENKDLHKDVLNKIMTKHEYRIKYDFGASLNI